MSSHRFHSWNKWNQKNIGQIVPTQNGASRSIHLPFSHETKNMSDVTAQQIGVIFKLMAKEKHFWISDRSISSLANGRCRWGGNEWYYNCPLWNLKKYRYSANNCTRNQYQFQCGPPRPDTHNAAIFALLQLNYDSTNNIASMIRFRLLLGRL